ncbi:MAG: class I SAM-dependent methyltransferase [Byssovorax sp.]
MSPTAKMPPARCPRLEKNAYADLRDLDDPEVVEASRAMEGFQLQFLAKTPTVWTMSEHFTGDVLYHFSRQWEYPYAWANLGVRSGKVLDAGSGITFFPFMLEAAGFSVACCDSDPALAGPYASANAALGSKVGFTARSIADMGYESASFDAIVCISVLEHVGEGRVSIVKEMARVLKPGGRLVMTCDLSLDRVCDTKLEDLALVLAEVEKYFGMVYPLDLYRGKDLLTTDRFLHDAPWRLPWRKPAPGVKSDLKRLVRGSDRPFHSIAVLGITAEKRA